MSELLSEGGFGCIYYPGLSCKKGAKTKKKDIVTKIQIKNFNADNEIYISKLITKIGGYNLFFLPVISSCSIDIRNLNKSIVEIDKCQIIDNTKNSYLAMDIPYVEQISFTEIVNKRSSKNIILIIIESFKYMLNALNKLNDVNIVHFDLKLENILFTNETTNPRIIDFGISIPINELSDSNMKKYFYSYAPSYYVWCLDIDIICYLLHKTDTTLTETDADLIATSNVANNKALEIFSPEFNKQFLEITKKQIKKYVGIDKNEVIKKMLTYSNTWDNYSLSIIYFRIIALLFPHNHHKNKLVILLSQILLLNIHPDPQKRLSIADTVSKFEDIFYIDDDVESYVNLAKNFNQNKLNTTTRIKEDINNLKLPKKY